MDMMGIIFSNIYDNNMGELTRERTSASIPFGSRYRQIDFALSNMANSKISNIGIVTKYNYQSLMDHLGNCEEWDLKLGEGVRFLPLRYLCDFYVKIIRGTPLIVQVYFFYYIIGTAWGIDNRVLAGIIILSLFSGAYIAEIVRGSLLSLDAGQMEAARAVGFTRAQTLRYVVAPQLVARTLPALTGQMASIIKDSSLLSVIAVIELTQTMREITATNYNFFGGFLLLGALYLVLTLPIMAVSHHFEKRLDYAH